MEAFGKRSRVRLREGFSVRGKPLVFDTRVRLSVTARDTLLPADRETQTRLVVKAEDANGDGTTDGRRSVSKQAIHLIGRENGVLHNTSLRTDIARFEMGEQCLTLTIERARDEVKAGVSLGAVSSLFKYYGTELNKRRHELLMAIGASDALVWEGGDSHDGLAPKSWLRSKANSIEGGTSEIQLNIVAKHLLGLPDLRTLERSQPLDLVDE